MHKDTQRRHVIDAIFPIALLFTFAATALIVLLLAANLYGKTHHQYVVNDEKYDALMYISEKLRQSDNSGNIHLENIDGTNCLAIDSRINDQSFTTYIYEYKGQLQELFAKSDLQISLNSGQSIMAIHQLYIEPIGDQLILIKAIDEDGHMGTLIASERSMP